MPERTIIPIAKQVCEALEVAHGHGEGVVHRDLSLDNIMVTHGKSGRQVIKVLDFGIAKEIGNDGLTNMSMGGPGTPAYAAPEQVEGRDVDQRADLFTLGVCLYGMMTGHEPWLGGSITALIEGGWKMLRQTVDADPIPVTDFNPEADGHLIGVTLKLLEKDPDDRFQNARELWEALDAIERGEAPTITVTRDRLKVVHAMEGVKIRVRRGSIGFLAKTVAEGATPWKASDMPPGTYRIEVTDPRFEKEVRKIDLVAGQDREIVLKARKR